MFARRQARVQESRRRRGRGRDAKTVGHGLSTSLIADQVVVDVQLKIDYRHPGATAMPEAAGNVDFVN
jgi:hypothetical protein